MKVKLSKTNQGEIESRLADAHDALDALDPDDERYDEEYVRLLNEMEELELLLPPVQKKTVGMVLDEEVPSAIASLRAHMKRVIKHIRLGKRKVFKEQIEACMAILDAFLEGKAPLLLAQPQQGKTEICLLVAKVFYDAMHEYVVQSNKYDDLVRSHESFYLTNIADNEIRKQTRDRVEDAGLAMPVIHHAEIGKVEQKTVKKRLIIVDECHIALGRDKPFHQFLRQCGVEYGNPVSAWKDRNNWILSVSATPYAHVIKTMIDKQVFTPIVLPMSADYYSLHHMYDDERLKQAEPVTRQENGGTVVTGFFRERMREFSDACERDGIGYMIVRARGASVNAIHDYVSRGTIRLTSDKRPKPQVMIFDCQEGNIAHLDAYLSKKPLCATVVIIRGSLRAGKTLQTVKYIKLWLESAGSKTDAMTQVIGRCLGYSRDRHTSKFPIYCNLAEIDLALAFYNDFYARAGVTVPTGNWNKRFADKQGYVQRIAPNYPDIPDEIRDRKPAPRIMTISHSNKQDLAQSVLNGSMRSIRSPIVKIDGMNPNHQESWRELMSAHPDWQGCYAYYVSDQSTATEESIRKKCMLRS